MTMKPWRDSGWRKAFTLIEVIGLLAIIAIFAAVLLRALVREIDTRYARQERAAVRELAEALQRRILRTGYFPDTSATAQGWAREVSLELGLDEEKVKKNSRGRSRVLLIDPGDVFSTFSLPYTQTRLGLPMINTPTRARLILASSTGPELPVFSSVVGTNEFAAYWALAPGSVPSYSIWNTFPPQDLVFERIDLSQHIHLLTLSTDFRLGGHPGQYNIGTEDINTVRWPVDNLPRWFLENTVVRLYHSDDSPSRTNALDTQHVLIHGEAFQYAGFVWQSGGSGPAFGGLDLAAIARQFLTCVDNTNAPANQQLTIVKSMINFMSNYVTWKDLYNLAPGTMMDYVTSNQNVMMVEAQRIFLKEGSTIRYPENSVAPCGTP